MTEAIVRAAIDGLLAEHDPTITAPEEFWEAQFDAGLAWVHFDEAFGGLGVDPGFQQQVDAELEAAGSSRDNIAQNLIGIGMGGPTVHAFGTDEQKRTYLRPMFATRDIWCQLFSEPGAGSDVAGLATRAVRDGDEWVVNGQKVWTTIAHLSRWGMLVTRTDPDAPKHQGMTYFILDMEAPGVEVRPLRQMTGEAEFNEVYLTDVRIPDSDRLGEVGDGWRVALATLMNERVAIGSMVRPRESGAIGEAVALWKERGGGTDAQRDALTKLWIEAEVNRLTAIRAGQNRTKGTPGPEGSTGKLHWADLNKRIYEWSVDYLGPEGMLFPSYEYRAPTEARTDHDLRWSFLRSRANSIEGGTTEIMKNILGERVLGLPGEPRSDKDLPWSEVPRS
ncbi:MAG: acyl-CoA dehydrogenase family protein [Acidimicrobiia bacterium]|nr:acyl-CoA dehydrogenase family protein [Acidimicrobiia bacterium]